MPKKATKTHTKTAASRKRSTSHKKTSSPSVRGKVKKVMHEFKEGALHMRSKRGPKVKSRKQAVAIALNEAGVSRKQTRKKASAKKRSR